MQWRVKVINKQVI